MENVMKNTKAKMEKTIESLKSEFGAVRAGRANPAILNKVTVNYYGTETPLSQIANISVPDARTLLIQPWDASAVKDVEKALQKSDIGINPSSDGKVIRLAIPPLTEERRKTLVKDVHKLAENGKVAVRNIRRDAMEKIKALKKNSQITEDDEKDGEKDLQKLTDSFIKEIDSLLKEKENEILTV